MPTLTKYRVAELGAEPRLLLHVHLGNGSQQQQRSLGPDSAQATPRGVTCVGRRVLMSTLMGCALQHPISQRGCGTTGRESPSHGQAGQSWGSSHSVHSWALLPLCYPPGGSASISRRSKHPWTGERAFPQARAKDASSSTHQPPGFLPSSLRLQSGTPSFLLCSRLSLVSP